MQKDQNIILTEKGNLGALSEINFLQVKRSSMILRAINHKLRQQILQLLEEQTKMTVTEIYVRLRLEQSIASQHLAILRRSGVVQTERDGKKIYYQLNHQKLVDIRSFTEQLLGQL